MLIKSIRWKKLSIVIIISLGMRRWRLWGYHLEARRSLTKTRFPQLKHHLLLDKAGPNHPASKETTVMFRPQRNLHQYHPPKKATTTTAAIKSTCHRLQCNETKTVNSWYLLERWKGRSCMRIMMRSTAGRRTWARATTMLLTMRVLGSTSIHGWKICPRTVSAKPSGTSSTKK